MRGASRRGVRLPLLLGRVGETDTPSQAAGPLGPAPRTHLSPSRPICLPIPRTHLLASSQDPPVS